MTRRMSAPKRISFLRSWLSQKDASLRLLCQSAVEDYKRRISSACEGRQISIGPSFRRLFLRIAFVAESALEAVWLIPQLCPSTFNPSAVNPPALAQRERFFAHY